MDHHRLKSTPKNRVKNRVCGKTSRSRATFGVGYKDTIPKLHPTRHKFCPTTRRIADLLKPFGYLIRARPSFVQVTSAAKNYMLKRFFVLLTTAETLISMSERVRLGDLTFQNRSALEPRRSDCNRFSGTEKQQVPFQKRKGICSRKAATLAHHESKLGRLSAIFYDTRSR